MLWEEEGVTQSEIARRLDLEQPTVANTLRRMERDGLVHLSPDPNNRRQVLIYLTDKGRALNGPLTAAGARHQRRGLGGAERRGARGLVWRDAQAGRGVQGVGRGDLIGRAFYSATKRR